MNQELMKLTAKQLSAIIAIFQNLETKPLLLPEKEKLQEAFELIDEVYEELLNSI